MACVSLIVFRRMEQRIESYEMQPLLERSCEGDQREMLHDMLTTQMNTLT